MSRASRGEVKLCGGGGVPVVGDRAGSMGPKVEARLRFARAGGASIIANLLDVEPALRGETGTCRRRRREA